MCHDAGPRVAPTMSMVSSTATTTSTGRGTSLRNTTERQYGRPASPRVRLVWTFRVPLRPCPTTTDVWPCAPGGSPERAVDRTSTRWRPHYVDHGHHPARRTVMAAPVSAAASPGVAVGRHRPRRRRSARTPLAAGTSGISGNPARFSGICQAAPKALPRWIATVGLVFERGGARWR